MICPLFYKEPLTGCVRLANNCVGKECAWYDGKQCAILSIMKALESIEKSGRKF